MTRVLVVYPRNIKNTPIEIPLLELKKRGHDVVHLTIDPPGGLHEYYTQIGVTNGSLESFGRTSFWFSPLRYWFIAKAVQHAIRHYKPDIVFGHLQEANFPLAIGKLFRLIKITIIFFRHAGNSYHLADAALNIKKPLAETFMDWLINGVATKIIVPGGGVLELMEKYEKADGNKMQIIPYQYDFESMKKSVNSESVNEIKSKYPADILLVSVMRFVPLKRHFLLPRVFNHLKDKGIRFHCLLLDDGPTKGEVQSLVQASGLAAYVTFLGKQPSVLPFLAAGDLVLHPSITDASNSVVKEAGLVGTPAVVVQGVGDFDDYIAHGKNSFIYPADAWVEGAVQVCIDLHQKKIDAPALGQALGQAVRQRFSVSDAIIDQYEALIKHPLRDS